MSGETRLGGLEPGNLVIAHYREPAEKYWGVLLKLDAAGVTLRGIGVGSFDDWMYQMGRGEEGPLGLTTMFVPMGRVERLDLDEQVGEVESYRQRFARQVGESVEARLVLPEG